MIAGAYSALNRREIPSTTPDWVNLDHRHGATIAPGNLVEFVRAAWELEGELYNYIEAVHRVTTVGAAVTRVTIGTSGDGFDAEWRTIDLMTVDGDRVSRFEMFDEDDFDAALARFDELHPKWRAAGEHGNPNRRPLRRVPRCSRLGRHCGHVCRSTSG